MAEALDELNARTGDSWADLARACGVSTAAVSGWKTGQTKTLEGTNLVSAAAFLGVTEAWLMGRSPVKRPVSNLSLVREDPDEYDVQIKQYQGSAVAAGKGRLNGNEGPTDYLTFKRSWLQRKGLTPESCCVVYADGDSMESRIRSGDVVLVRTDVTDFRDDHIYAFVFGEEARLKRVLVRANSYVLVSDNDPHGDRREEVSGETLRELHLIGLAVWLGGDLR